jgi:anti-sigma B factor antagonist
MSNYTPGVGVEDIVDGGEHRLLLSGELEIASVPTLEGAVKRLCTEGTTAITLDLSELMFIDSTGLAAIIFAGRLCEKHGYGFSLIQGPRAVQRLFELTGLIDVLPFRDEQDRSDPHTATGEHEPGDEATAGDAPLPGDELGGTDVA